MSETLGLPVLPATSQRKVPVVETFGPTIQGEGPLAGVPTYFVRFGLCDYRCSWCDSMYAVDPVTVKANAERMSAEEVCQVLSALPPGPRWVTLSGGNPAIHDLSLLVSMLRTRGLRVAVETQASKFPTWLESVDMLVASPKPPSSGMVTPEHTSETTAFLDWANRRIRQDRRALKIVVFDSDDLDWAIDMVEANPHWDVWLSVGTPVPDDQPTEEILDRFAWLAERVANDGRLRDVRVLPQLHVLAWGQVRGV